MHGRPRKPQKPEDESASAAKAEKLRSLQSLFLANHHNKNFSKEALEVSAKLLEINPESYTAWNYRKLAVEHYLSQPDVDPDSIKSILDEELRVVESALRQNFKSYGAWHHRKWILSKGNSSIDHELRLLEKFQKADSRNFHAWNYRRFVAELLKRSEEDELQYTTDMINTNFSNYSAWHNRSILLSNLLRKKVERFYPKEKVLTEEFELVHQAIFTDPDDQSGWFYYLWLLDQTVKTDSPQLVSSWPADGQNVTLGNTCLDDCSGLGMFPLVLYFDQAVEGVNSSTVTVKSILKNSRDLLWKARSTIKSKASKVWVANLYLTEEELCCPEGYKVEVSLGHSPGILSSGGFHFSHHSQITFKVSVLSAGIKPAEGPVSALFSWKDENFLSLEPGSLESNSPLSFDRLSIKDENQSSTLKWRVETISNEISLFRELLPEINCKIGKLTLARLLMAYEAMLSPHANTSLHCEEILELYRDLIKLDPSHSQYYNDERSLVLLQQVISSKESLLRRCYCYKEMTSSSTRSPIYLRLNNLSISRLGSTERLLWVQVLDLSDNNLHSIEGLEAMQQLLCLSVSNNKLGSFSALGPLRQVKSLKVLNISHNEIGSHSIDTARYSFPSPLSHTEEMDWSPDEFVSDGINAKNYWEAYLIFKDLNLTQLETEGNELSDEKFKSFLVKILPTLKWLDGVQVHETALS